MNRLEGEGVVDLHPYRSIIQDDRAQPKGTIKIGIIL